MDKDTRDFLLVVGSAALLGWLLSKKHGKCPRCNYPVTNKDSKCPNCGQWLDWRKF